MEAIRVKLFDTASGKIAGKTAGKIAERFLDYRRKFIKKGSFQRNLAKIPGRIVQGSLGNILGILELFSGKNN